jgi:hypothetical protein
VFLEQPPVGAGGDLELSAGNAGHDFAQDGGMIFGFVLTLGALDAERGQILAQSRQRALVQEAGDVLGAVGHQFAAADANEQIEKFALDFAGVSAASSISQREMSEAERRRIAAQLCKPLQKFRVRRPRQ